MNEKIEAIINNSKSISPEKIGQEVLAWVISNVESFIDNQNKVFKLDLVVDEAEGMEESKKLNDLYKNIPDDEESCEKTIDESEKCRRTLDEITNKAFEYIKNNVLLEKLFERMSFYYGKVIKSPENKARAIQIDKELKELFHKKELILAEDQSKLWNSTGACLEIQKQIVEKIQEGERLVKFSELDGIVSITKFEYDAFEVGVQIKDANNEEGEERKILKDYVIPEGFTIWLEINFKNKQRPTSMF